MTCCMTNGGAVTGATLTDSVLAAEAGRDPVTLRLAVPRMHCGGCIRQVEQSLAKTPGVRAARANLGAKTVTVEWAGSGEGIDAITEALDRAGFEAFPIDSAAVDDADVDDEAAAADDEPPVSVRRLRSGEPGMRELWLRSAVPGRRWLTPPPLLLP